MMASTIPTGPVPGPDIPPPDIPVPGPDIPSPNVPEPGPDLPDIPPETPITPDMPTPMRA